MKTTTTLQNIKDFGPCKSGWTKLIKNVRKANNIEKGKITPLTLEVSYLFILESNGMDDAFWSLRTNPSLAAFIANSYAEYAAEYAAKYAAKYAKDAKDAAESVKSAAEYARYAAEYAEYATKYARHAAESAAICAKYANQSFGKVAIFKQALIDAENLGRNINP